MRNNVKSIISTLLILQAAFASAFASGEISQRISGGRFTPNNPPLVHVREGALEVASIKTEKGVGVSIKLNGVESRTVDLSDLDIAQVEMIRKLSGNRIAVAGFVNSLVSKVVILDTRTGKALDNFFAYQPAFSLDGNYIAFIRFFPPHAGGEVEDCYAVFDTSLLGKANRSLKKELPAQRFEEEKHVGMDVYPTRNASGGAICGDDVNAEEGGHKLVSGGFIWSTRGNEFVFVDQIKNKLTLVLVRKSQKSKSEFETFTYELNEHGNLCEETCLGKSVLVQSFDRDSVTVEVLTLHNSDENSGSIVVPFSAFR